MDHLTPETSPVFQALRGVVFDWAGTIFDFGSQAPMVAFVELFRRHGVEISIEDARGPMGLPKWLHIQTLGELPHVMAQWAQVHGRSFSDADVDMLYAEFTPMNAESVQHHAELIPGTAELIDRLKSSGIAVGTTTGYNRPIMEKVLPLAKAQGLVPDAVVCADDLAVSRPTPMAMYKCALDLNVWPLTQMVKVDDTLPGLMEGRHAGCMTVAVMLSGNEAGLTQAEYDAVKASGDETQLEALRAKVRSRLSTARPDFWVDTVADLWPVLLEADQRMVRRRLGESF